MLDPSRHPSDSRSFASFATRASVVVGVTVFAVTGYLLTRWAFGWPAGWRDVVPLLVLFASMWALHELRLLSPSSGRRWVYWAEMTRDAVAVAGVFIGTILILRIWS